MKKNCTGRYSKLALAVGMACAGLAGRQAVAQQTQQPVEEVTVTGTRLATSGVNTPTPVTAVSGVDLQTMEPGTVIDSLKQLPQFYNNLTTQQSAGGSVAAGGSNVNLRGLSAQRTLALLDGRRIGPSNKFGTVDVAVLPEMLIQSVEAVTGGASAAYGADAVAGVVNFRLDNRFTGLKYSVQGGTTTYNDDNNYKAGVAYGTAIGQRGHIVASIETYHKDGTNSFQGLQDRSDIFKLNAQVTNPAYNAANPSAGGPNFLARPNVSPTYYTPGGVIYASAPFALALDATGHSVPLPASLDHVEFLPDGSGQYRQLPFSGVGQLSGGCNCQSRPTLEYGVNSDSQADTRADRDALFTHFDYDVNDRNSFFLETLLSDTDAANRWQTVALLGPWTGRVFVDNPYLPAGIQQDMQNAGIYSVGYAIFTPNTQGNPFDGAELIAKNRYGQMTGGFTHDLPDEFLAGHWSLDGYVQYAQNRQETVVPGGIRTDRLFLAMDAVADPVTGQPVCRATLFNPGLLDDCVPIDLFGGTPAITPAAANYVRDNGKIARGRTTEDDVELTLRGNLTKGSDGALGPITAAFGVSWREEQLGVKTVDPCDEFPCTPAGVLFSDIGLNPLAQRGIQAGVNLNGTVNPNGVPGLRFVPNGFAGDSNSSTVLFSSQRAVDGGYNVREAFFEFGIPLFHDKLNFDEAFRAAAYSGSGNANAWKSGLSWQATPKLRVRATRSQDVRAPTLQERFESQRGGVNVRDPAQNNDLISTASFSGGNENVGLETALTDTVGVVYQPLDKFSMTLDSYDINLDGAIGLLTAQNIVDGCYNSAGHNSSSLCQYVIRDATGEINRVDAVYINLSNQRVRGLDLELNLNGIEVGRGTLGWRLIGSRLNENSILSPGTKRDDRAGDVGTQGLPKSKVTTNVNYTRGPVSIFLQERYIGGGKNDRTLVESSVGIPGVNTIDNNTVDSVMYTDLTFTYSAGGKTGNPPWQFFFNVLNLANTAPPDMYPVLGRAGVAGPNSFLYDTIGRRFAAGVRVNF